MTDFHGQRPAADPLASQRAALLGKLIAAQSSLERVVAELVRSGVSTAVADGQLAQLAGLQASVGIADAASLHQLSGEIGSAIAQARGVEQQARDQIATANATERDVNLGQAATAARTALREAMDSLRDIPLHFTSREDERAYRDREAERQAYIAAQQAKHTLQGDLNAAGAGVGQMVDAKAHGASGSEFEQKWQTLVSTTERLRAEAKANGLSTDEFDQRLRDDLRRIMKSKGYSDAQIEAQLASNPDPLQAAKAFLKDGKDIEAVTAQVSTDHAYSTVMAASPPASATKDAAALIASFKASGLTTSESSHSGDPHPGVAVAAISPIRNVGTGVG